MCLRVGAIGHVCWREFKTFGVDCFFLSSFNCDLPVLIVLHIYCSFIMLRVAAFWAGLLELYCMVVVFFVSVGFIFLIEGFVDSTSLAFSCCLWGVCFFCYSALLLLVLFFGGLVSLSWVVVLVVLGFGVGTSCFVGGFLRNCG